MKKTPADEGIAAAKADVRTMRGRTGQRVLITITRPDGMVLDSFEVVGDWRNAGLEQEAVGTNATEALLVDRIKRAMEVSAK